MNPSRVWAAGVGRTVAQLAASATALSVVFTVLWALEAVVLFSGVLLAGGLARGGGTQQLATASVVLSLVVNGLSLPPVGALVVWALGRAVPDRAPRWGLVWLAGAVTYAVREAALMADASQRMYHMMWPSQWGVVLSVAVVQVVVCNLTARRRG